MSFKDFAFKTFESNSITTLKFCHERNIIEFFNQKWWPPHILLWSKYMLFISHLKPYLGIGVGRIRCNSMHMQYLHIGGNKSSTQVNGNFQTLH